MKLSLMDKKAQHKALELLQEVSTEFGFLASAEKTTNYARVWARDGVICGLAALASKNEKLIATFKATLNSLQENQHKIGTIPSNILFDSEKKEVSYGGLAGRVDAITWYIIGVCQYAYHQKDTTFFEQHKKSIDKCLFLLNAWEFNNRDLIYTPLSGNWADEYITDGYVLYDQLLRFWALKCYNHFLKSTEIRSKLRRIQSQIQINFTKNSTKDKYHQKAYNEVKFQEFLPCSFSPSGYKNQMDAFANSLFVFLKLDVKHNKSILKFGCDLANNTKLGLIPAFWPPIYPEEEDWNLLKNNCKYEFRNFPNEFHNGGSWQMVNGFFALALLSENKTEEATQISTQINAANKEENYSFFENFNTETQAGNGVTKCAWSAAATVLVQESLCNNFELLK